MASMPELAIAVAATMSGPCHGHAHEPLRTT
jgi:hypothetical protein